MLVSSEVSYREYCPSKYSNDSGYYTNRIYRACVFHYFIQAVKKFMKLSCKCHGVSGACTIRTCWQAMQPFRRVGEYLKRKYNGATHVMIDQGGSGIVVANHHFKKPTRKDLVYLESSPDYCLRDLSIGKTCFNYLRVF